MTRGYEFIEKSGPNSNNKGQFIKWTDEQVNDPENIIFGWMEGKVKEYLRALMMGKQTAKTLDFWPITLRNVKPWVLEEVSTKLIGTLRFFGIWWIGETQTGKSQAP